ncbi:MAG TPA: cupin domain-containing protein [Candidatus Bathyarchaeota archaeon]|nr:cupin domain-containing protein [Candidatus Bathyarchaeota archaeon]
MEKAKVFNLSQMVEAQEGSVVSRTLVDRPAGTVTLFAFDGGQGLSEHTAPYDALVYILEGEAVVTVSGVEHRVSAGEALLMPAGEPHSLRAEEAFKMLLVMVRG